jgi:uncharacterized protein (DUF885 family)
MRRLFLTLICLTTIFSASAIADPLDQLASDFWTWRAKYAPFTSDDVPRLEHPGGPRDWSTVAITKQRADLAEFERRWKEIKTEGWPVARQVDYQLIGSALARVHWELDVNPRWQRDPAFYVGQTVSALQDALLPPAPFDQSRCQEIIVRAENIPYILQQAKVNLRAVAPFAQLTIEWLSDIDARMARVGRGVAPLLADDTQRARFHTAMASATVSLVRYREWLKQTLPTMHQDFALGREKYEFFLHRVALLPFTPEQLLTMARQDFDRTLSLESYEQQRDLNAPELTLAASTEELASRMAHDDAAIRSYLTQHEILTVPPDLPHWTIRSAPDYLVALNGFGELDDFTSPSRLQQNGVRWSLPPSKNSPYFDRAYALDARTTGVHEGIPGHFFQLSLAWRNPDEIRRHYYDSGVNEGIGFYAEEMMLQAGLYDDSPRSREIIYNFMRLRALRVEVDVKLALGEFSIAQAADYFARTVPMDRQTAEGEAADFSAAPGLAIDYEIGKLQIERLLADRRLQLGDKFTLCAFHDYLWVNGNVPLSLQRLELLNDPSGLDRLSAPAK